MAGSSAVSSTPVGRGEWPGCCGAIARPRRPGSGSSAATHSSLTSARHLARAADAGHRTHERPLLPAAHPPRAPTRPVLTVRRRGQPARRCRRNITHRSPDRGEGRGSRRPSCCVPVTLVVAMLLLSYYISTSRHYNYQHSARGMQLLASPLNQP